MLGDGAAVVRIPRAGTMKAAVTTAGAGRERWTVPGVTVIGMGDVRLPPVTTRLQAAAAVAPAASPAHIVAR
ncbi:MAG: hypothetical protein ABJA33_04520, partial [Pedococcus sp.]